MTRLDYYVLYSCLAWAVGLAQARRPNILFILTDDQDGHMQSLEHMPYVQSLLVDQGTSFSRHYCTVAICCPSRVNLWTGRAAHNTNVTDVVPPYGGYPKIVREGINDDYLPVWLQQAGYNTYYTGKLWNSHSVTTYNKPLVKGFNGSDFLLDPFTYRYWNATMSRNGGQPVSYEGQYSPDVTARKAHGFLLEALERPEPWFVVHAPIAPHGEFRHEGGKLITELPGYTERHADLFKDYIIPRDDENFNPEVQGGVSWIRNLPRLSEETIALNDEYQRARLRSLQAVDESVRDMVETLRAKGELDNTYIFFTTDNGYHISQHRMLPGKMCGFETDVKIPFVVRGPGIPAGEVSEAVTSHTDVASTIMRIVGGVEGRRREGAIESDGTPMPLWPSASLSSDGGDGAVQTERHEHVTLEFWGRAFPEGVRPYPPENVPSLKNNTYKAIRVIGEEYNLYYSVWCTNETELYDLKDDPGQIRNLLDPHQASLATEYTIAGRSLSQVLVRLDSLTMVLKSCKGIQCVQPWRTLHPEGDVHSLLDSLRPGFDAFYADQPRVSFRGCEAGYIKEAEGPMEVNRFDDWWDWRGSGDEL